MRGDVTLDGNIDIADLTLLIKCFFVDCLGVCLDHQDFKRDSSIDISDVVYLVKFMFHGGDPPSPI